MEEVRSYYRAVESVFEKLAPYYDLVTLPFLKLREQVVDFTAPPDGSTILDIATGTGAQAFAFARRGHLVVGVDLSEPMIGVAQKKNRDRKVKFEVADATKLPYLNDTFDVASISFALHDMPLVIREKVLREMVRVTKPAGSIVIVDYDLPRTRLGRWLIFHLVRLYEREYYVTFIRSEVRGLLSQVGIEIAQERPVLLGAARIIKGLKLPKAVTVGN